MKRIHLWSLLWIYAVLTTAPGCSPSNGNTSSDNNSAVPVTVTTVETMDVPHFFEQVGTLKANEAVLVKAETSGIVTVLAFEEGQRVKAGSLLARLEDATIKAEIKRLKSQIKQYRLQLANTEKSLKRKRRLFKGDVLSEQELDDLVTKKGVEQELIKQTQAGLLIAGQKLIDTEIRAPFDGITSERLIAAGDYLTAGDPIVNVVQLEPLKVSLRVFEKFKSKISRDTPATVTIDAYPGQTFTGTVCFISPDVDPATRTFLVKALLPNADHRLNPGMFARVSLEYERHRQALVVPWDAVVQMENHAFVFAVRDLKAHRVSVTVLKTMGTRAEVAGGLQAGDAIVVEGKFTVQDGGPVRVVPAGK